MEDHHEDEHGHEGEHASEMGAMSPQDVLALRNAKIILLVLIGFFTYLFSVAPWGLSRLFKQRALDVVNVLSALAAGIIFGSFMAHMVPETLEGFEHYLEPMYGAESKVTHFPWATVTAGGIFIVLFAVDRLLVAHGAHGHGQAGAGHHAGHSHALGGRGGEHDHVSDALQGMARHVEDAEAAAAAAASSQGEASASLTEASVSLPPDAEEEGERGSLTAAQPGGTTTTSSSSSSSSDVALTIRTVAPTKDAATGTGTTTLSLSSSAAAAAVHPEAVMRAWVFTVAISVHAFFDGLAMGAEGSLTGFYSVLAAVVAHKAFDGLATGAALFPAGYSLLGASPMLGLAAVMTPVGVAVGLGITAGLDPASRELAEAIIVSLSAGSFLFIALVELLPAALHDGRWVKTKLAAFAVGFAALCVLGIAEEAH